MRQKSGKNFVPGKVWYRRHGHKEEGRFQARPNAFLERKFGFLAERIFAFADNYDYSEVSRVTAGPVEYSTARRVTAYQETDSLVSRGERSVETV